MRDRLLVFIDALRAAGIGASPAESLDAVNAVTVAGIAREALRETLSATLVKDRADRPIFDELFDRHFPVLRPQRKRGAPREPAGEGIGRGGEGDGRGRTPRQESRGEQGPESRALATRPEPRQQPSRAAVRLSQRQSALAKPFREMAPRAVEEQRDLVKELAARFRARCARRFQRTNRGRIDMRSTIRRATTRGGVPLELRFRHPRPGKIDLLALVDLSYSTVAAAEFLLALLAPARAFFRRTRLFAYVDAPVEISYEHGHIVPHQPLDLAARSDFGAVLRSLTADPHLSAGRNTVMLVLGDARNNRRPPRADLLAGLARQVRALLWLNPEAPERWDSGDSVMATYARYASVVLPAYNLQTLASSLAVLAKTSI